MADGSLAVAIAGGAGAFLGAAVGQVVQWVRDHQHEEKIDQRDRRARRQDHYLHIQTVLQRLHHALERTEFAASIWGGMKAPQAKHYCLECRQNASALAAEPLTEATALAAVVGSPQLRDMFKELNFKTAGLGAAPSEVMVEHIDTDGYRAAAEEAGHHVDLDHFMEKRPLTDAEIARDIQTEAKRLMAYVEEIQDQIRTELDLAQ